MKNSQEEQMQSRGRYGFGCRFFGGCFLNEGKFLDCSGALRILRISSVTSAMMPLFLASGCLVTVMAEPSAWLPAPLASMHSLCYRFPSGFTDPVVAMLFERQLSGCSMKLKAGIGAGTNCGMKKQQRIRYRMWCFMGEESVGVLAQVQGKSWLCVTCHHGRILSFPRLTDPALRRWRSDERPLPQRQRPMTPATIDETVPWRRLSPGHSAIEASVDEDDDPRASCAATLQVEMGRVGNDPRATDGTLLMERLECCRRSARVGAAPVGLCRSLTTFAP